MQHDGNVATERPNGRGGPGRDQGRHRLLPPVAMLRVAAEYKRLVREAAVARYESHPEIKKVRDAQARLQAIPVNQRRHMGPQTSTREEVAEDIDYSLERAGISGRCVRIPIRAPKGEKKQFDDQVIAFCHDHYGVTINARYIIECLKAFDSFVETLDSQA